MHFLDKGDGEEKASESILDVSVRKAMTQVIWERIAFAERGGFYDWTKASEAGYGSSGDKASNYTHSVCLRVRNILIPSLVYSNPVSSYSLQKKPNPQLANNTLRLSLSLPCPLAVTVTTAGTVEGWVPVDVVASLEVEAGFVDVEVDCSCDEADESESMSDCEGEEAFAMLVVVGVGVTVDVGEGDGSDLETTVVEGAALDVTESDTTVDEGAATDVTETDTPVWVGKLNSRLFDMQSVDW
jgi:hypothetical protein